MNLERVTAALRPRNPWEAADFGARMIQRDAATIYRVWFAVTLPLAIIAVLALLFTDHPTLVTLAFWWLEPLADGPMLYVISRRLFGETPTVGAALRATPQLAWRNRIFLLSPYRFHIARSIAMPLTQLEGLSGKQRRQRAAVLGHRIMRYGTGITVAYQHLALAFYAGVFLLVFALIPPEYQDTVGRDWLDNLIAGHSTAATVLGFLAGYLAQTALQPWFVGCGFGLYINCRTELEAWDLEIAFRQLTARRAGALRAAAPALACCFVVAACLLSSLPVSAQQDAPETTQLPSATPSDPVTDEVAIRSALDDIMASDEFRTTQEVRTWRKIGSGENDEPSDGRLPDWLLALGKLLASGFEVILWTAASVCVAALIFVAVKKRKHASPGSAAFDRPQRATRVLIAGGAISADSLPADVPAEGLRLWRSGERRGALSLLYRASVLSLVVRHGVRLPTSATEGMCVAAVDRQAPSAPAQMFRQIVTAWTWCAYAARDPDAELIESICGKWAEHFGAPQ